MMMPSLSALITYAAGPQERGALSGAQQGLGSLARILAPPLDNTLIGLPHGTGIPFFLAAALMGISFLLSLRLRPLPHRTASPASTEPAARPGENPASNGESAADLAPPPLEAGRE